MTIPFETTAEHEVAASTASIGGTPPRIRVAVAFSMLGDLRFLSHHDEMRMLTRAVIRSRWPVRFSQGFNPKPRFTLPLPRSVGVASECELALFDLTEPANLPQLVAALRGQLPAGAHLHRAGYHPRSTPHPQRVIYRVEFDAVPADLTARITGVLAKSSLPVMRRGEPGSPARRLDIRAMIESISLRKTSLRMELNYVEQRSARPTEILELLDLDPREIGHRITRESIEWDTKLFDPADGIVNAEELNIEQGKEAQDRT